MAAPDREAYVLACIELEAASQAFGVAEARLRAARAECERLEAALDMTRLSEGLFPELGCTAAGQPEPVAPSRRKRSGRG